MVLITIVRGGYKQTYNVLGSHVPTTLPPWLRLNLKEVPPHCAGHVAQKGGRAGGAVVDGATLGAVQLDDAVLPRGIWH